MDMLATISITKVIVGIILGIVQGISEWLPISSKTQILLISTLLLHLNFSQAYALGLFMEGGTFLAAVIYFRKELYKTILALVGKGGEEGKLLLKYLVIVTIVTAIVSIPIYKLVSSVNGPVIGVPMIILGVLLIIDGFLIRFSRNKHTTHKELKTLTIMDLIFIGISQGISALPGVSRSGTTVSAMLFMKVKPEEAFRLSFFALILSSIGATAVTIIFSKPQLTSVFAVFPIIYIVIAAIVSIAISLVLINALIESAKSNKITNLVFVLGIIAIIGGIIGILTGLAAI
jgi:undecaprenyl-diphosphatase